MTWSGGVDMGIHVSETLMRRYLNNSMARLNEIIESGDKDQQLNAATQLANIILNIARLEQEDDSDDREYWQKFEDDLDEDEE